MGSEHVPWQRKSWDRRVLWDLVASKFAKPGKVGRASVTITRDDLMEAGIAHMLDDLDAPTTSILPSFMEEVDSVRRWSREHGEGRDGR